MTKKIYIIAGELSGDILGANLIKNLNLMYPENFALAGIGGPKMLEQGLSSLFPIKLINLMGFAEVIPHIFRLKKLIKTTVDDIINVNPDIVITIDSPGFNFRVVELAKKKSHNIKFVHYVAPSVWAYKEKRAQYCAKTFDHLLALFPFEAPYFNKYNLPVTCVGHPLFETNFDNIDKNSFRIKYNIDPTAQLLCVTPGSRKGEITRHLSILITALNELSIEFNNLVIAIPTPSSVIAYFLKTFLKETKFKVIIVENEEDRTALYRAANFALAKSGTNTLEISACGTAQMIFYKLNIISWYYLKLMIKVKYASIVNILADKAIIPEFLQNDFTPKNIVHIVKQFLSDDSLRQKQVQAAQSTLEQIGYKKHMNSSQLAAKVIAEILDLNKIAS